ncbi:MAG: formate hydrogenlyase [Actinobacteria bacterium]|nr:MAG: formate hydrogenlyase [Actinomycetota bacterium]
MSAQALLSTVVQVVVVAAGGPLLVGVLGQTRARLEGRAGAGIGQPWRDLRKLVRRQPATPTGTAWMLLGVATVALLACWASPGYLAAAPGSRRRTRWYGILLQLFVAAMATAVLAGNFGVLWVAIEATTIVTATLHAPLRVASPASLLAAAALVIVVVAETGRLPVDNPATHLELTMIHEAMVLEYAGGDLALIEWASSVRLTVLLGLLASLFAPWGIAATNLAALPVAFGALVVKVTILGAGLGAAEVFLAKLRLFRVPELLAGSFVLALLAVTSSFFLA